MRTGLELHTRGGGGMFGAVGSTRLHARVGRAHLLALVSHARALLLVGIERRLRPRRHEAHA